MSEFNLTKMYARSMRPRDILLNKDNFQAWCTRVDHCAQLVKTSKRPLDCEPEVDTVFHGLVNSDRPLTLPTS